MTSPNDFVSCIADCVLNECGMTEGARILVGVSGGIDSLTLLLVLCEAGFDCIAALYDHRLRPESADEAAFVRDFCVSRGIPFVSGSGDVAAYAKTEHLSTEDAARQLRYRFLFSAARDSGAAAVAAAHHSDDQAETVLLHLIRGCGADGLCGMRPRTLPNSYSRDIPLIRPLLCVSRKEIEDWFGSRGLPHVEDASNRDTTYLRNRIRMQLLPELEASYNPRIRSVLCRLAENARQEKDELDRQTDAVFPDCVIDTREGQVCLKRSVFKACGPAIRVRILRRVLPFLSKDTADFGSLAMERLFDFLNCALPGINIPWQGGISVFSANDRLYFYVGSFPETESFYPQFPGKSCLPTVDRLNFPDWEYCQEFREPAPELIDEARKDRFCCVLNADRIAGEVFLRVRRSGDRFAPLGLDGSQKLSDMMITFRIPRIFRDSWPLLCDAAGILWVPGITIAGRAAVDAYTKRVLRVRIIDTRNRTA